MFVKSNRPRDQDGILLGDGDVVLWRDKRFEVYETNGKYWLVDLESGEQYPPPEPDELDLRERYGS